MNDFRRPHNGPDHEEDRLRRLLDDAVSDVEPREALGSIHARTRQTPAQSRRPWLLGAGAAVLATAATVAAVTVLGDGGTTGDPDFAGPTSSATPTEPGPSEPTPGEPTPSEPAPTPSPTDDPTPTDDPSPSSTPPAGEVVAVPVYYVGETSRGPRLFREFHRVETADAPSSAVNEAVATPPADRDYWTAWPAGTTAEIDDTGPSDVITVDVQGEGLRERPSEMSAEEAGMSVEQLVYTAQAAMQERSPVQFLVNGERTDQLLGVPVSEPVSQGAAEDVLAQVWIIEPGEHAEVKAPFKVSGLAAAYEATVVWELRKGDRVVEEGYTTAEECCTMAPYSFEVDAAPGVYTLVVQDTDPSGGEGFGPWIDTKQITVVP